MASNTFINFFNKTSCWSFYSLDCGDTPSDALYGNFTLDNEGVTTYGANATLLCDEGFESSDPVITCQEYNNWSKYEPCVIKGIPNINTFHYI